MSVTNTLAPTTSINYTATDYPSLMAWARSRIPQICPEWTDTTEADFGIVVVEILAGFVDMLKTYMDAVMNEAYIDTARTRDSMISLLKLINYQIDNAKSATSYFVYSVQLTPTSPSVTLPQLVPAYITASDGTFIYFESSASVTVSLPVNTTILSVITPVEFTVNNATNIQVGNSYYFGGANNSTYTVVALSGNTLTISAAPAKTVVVGDLFTSPAGVYASQQVLVYEGQTHFQELIGTSDGLPSLEFTLAYAPVLDNNANGGSALTTDPNQILLFVNEGTGALVWTEISDFAYAGPNDNVYTTSVDQNGYTQIQLGNNQNGRIPAFGAQVTATYRTGGGSRGNISEGIALALVFPVAGVVSVTNAVQASGGEDQETINQARASAPSELATQERDVTANDFATDIILADNSIIAVQMNSQSWNVVVASILTNTMTPGSNAIAASTEANINSRLAPRMMLTERLILSPVTLTSLLLGFNLYVSAGYSQALVSAQFEQAVLNYFVLGNLNIAQSVYMSVLEALGQAIPGVDHVDTVFSGPFPNAYGDVPIGAGQVAYLLPTNLTITVSGGF